MRRRALLALALAPLPAHAFRLQEAPADVKASWVARCTGLRADDGEAGICPLCGCTLVGDAKDHGETP